MFLGALNAPGECASNAFGFKKIFIVRKVRAEKLPLGEKTHQLKTSSKKIFEKPTFLNFEQYSLVKPLVKPQILFFENIYGKQKYFKMMILVGCQCWGSIDFLSFALPALQGNV